MNQIEAAHTVIETIMQMAQEQRPLMLRVVPPDEVHFWKHYPVNDARDAKCRSRWYYHVHAPGSRDEGEHGHFHLFLQLLDQIVFYLLFVYLLSVQIQYLYHEEF